MNAVAFMDASPNIIVSGSDDTSIKVGARPYYGFWFQYPCPWFYIRYSMALIDVHTCARLCRDAH